MDAITQGFWIVDLYSEDGVVMTSNYAGFEFKFNDNETLNAFKSGNFNFGNLETQYHSIHNYHQFPYCYRSLLIN